VWFFFTNKAIQKRSTLVQVLAGKIQTVHPNNEAGPWEWLIGRKVHCRPAANIISASDQSWWLLLDGRAFEDWWDLSIVCG